MWLLLSTLIAAGGGLELRSAKPFLVLGQDTSTEIAISGSGGKDVQLSVNVGEVSAPKKGEGGRWLATYTPPAAHFPQLAIFFARAVGAEGHRWLALPLHGRETLSLEAKPHAQVRLTVGDSVFGPVKADARG